mmetsp:Transcript_35725/g.93809  ORF Transcript_35725/g.93809 Transcript_35725/m.93809 type:complete len:257 (-) Transcript_35725:243-1013(-)
MFCSMTQPPEACMRSSAFSATGSWPWPSETVIRRPSSSVIFVGCVRPSARTSAVASTPGESRKKMGTAGPESSKETGRSKLIASPYGAPRTEMTHVRSASVMRSGRSARMMSSCWNPPRRFQSVGSGSSSGVGWSDHSFQRFHEPSRSVGKLENSSCASASAQADPHASSVSHAETGFSLELSRGLATIRSSSIILNSPLAREMLMASCVEKVRRWRSKRPDETNLKSVYVTDSSRLSTRWLTSPSSGSSALSSAL